MNTTESYQIQKFREFQAQPYRYLLCSFIVVVRGGEYSVQVEFDHGKGSCDRHSLAHDYDCTDVVAVTNFLTDSVGVSLVGAPRPKRPHYPYQYRLAASNGCFEFFAFSAELEDSDQTYEVQFTFGRWSCNCPYFRTSALDSASDTCPRCAHTKALWELFTQAGAKLTPFVLPMRPSRWEREMSASLIAERGRPISEVYDSFGQLVSLQTAWNSMATAQPEPLLLTIF